MTTGRHFSLRHVWHFALGLFASSCIATAAAADIRNLPVPTVTLYPGDLIQERMLGETAFTVNDAILVNYVVDARQIQNKYARRTLVAGQPIALSSIRDREVVQRGKAAQAIFRTDGLLISTVLVPLESGEAGQVIQARNTESGMVVSVTVQADGSLMVGEP